MKTISVIIPVYNVEDKIARCLDALRWADEVVVVDMLSTDRTREICESFPNVRFYQNKDYIYANVNFGIDHASGDWLMRLDSDEVVSPELAKEIRERVLSADVDDYSGYWVPNRVYFFGKWLRFGPAYDPRSNGKGFGYRKVLFKKGTARYECKREHEDLTTTGEYGYLEGHYDHYSHDSISHWISKMNYYTDRDVERMGGDSVRLSRGYSVKLAVVPVIAFLKLYLQFRGYKDGMHGFVACALHASYLFVERSKAWEREWKERALTSSDK